MPIPNRRKKEDKNSFVQRCMTDSVMKKEFPDEKQRLAVCNSQSEKKKAKGDVIVLFGPDRKIVRDGEIKSLRKS